MILSLRRMKGDSLMLKSMKNFPHLYLDFDFIVVHNNDFLPLNSFGGSVYLDRGGVIYEWHSSKNSYEVSTHIHDVMINANVIALCEHGGYYIPSLNLDKRIAVNFTLSELTIIDTQFIWTINDIDRIRIVNKSIYDYDGYIDIHNNGNFLRIMCKQWHLNYFKYVAQEISLVKTLTNESFELKIT